MSVQLAIEVPAPTVMFIQVCHLCDREVSRIEAPVAEKWTEPLLWSYVAQKEHERLEHGGR